MARVVDGAIAALKAKIDNATGVTSSIREEFPKSLTGTAINLVEEDPLLVDEDIGSPRFYFEHIVNVEITIDNNDVDAATTELSGIVETIASAMAADTQLGGAVDYAEPGVPTTPISDFPDGAEGLHQQTLPITLSYQSTLATG